MSGALDDLNSVGDFFTALENDIPSVFILAIFATGTLLIARYGSKVSEK